MSLRKTENQVKDLLTETIVALCRNTLNRYGEVCVEGLLGVTLDKQEIFLVSINQQIENRKLGEQGIVHSSETSGDLSRKRANESDDDGTSDSYSEVSESDGSRVKRKRRRKRKHSRNSQGNSSGEESCQSGDDRETFPTFDLSELKKTGFLSQDSQFSVHSDGLNDFNDGVLSLENNQSHDLDAHQRLDTPIKSEVEDIDHQTSVIKEEREDEECWPSGDNLNEHSTTSGFQTQDKSLSNSHGANPGLGSDESEDADHSVSEQGGPGPSTLNSGARASEVKWLNVVLMESTKKIKVPRKSFALKRTSEFHSEQRTSCTRVTGNFSTVVTRGSLALTGCGWTDTTVDPSFNVATCKYGITRTELPSIAIESARNVASIMSNGTSSSSLDDDSSSDFLCRASGVSDIKDIAAAENKTFATPVLGLPPAKMALNDGITYVTNVFTSPLVSEKIQSEHSGTKTTSTNSTIEAKNTDVRSITEEASNKLFQQCEESFFSKAVTTVGAATFLQKSVDNSAGNASVDGQFGSMDNNQTVGINTPISQISKKTVASCHLKFSCSDCGIAFTTAKRLTRHSVIHTPSKMHQCPLCDLRFGLQINLRDHIKTTHIDQLLQLVEDD